MLKCTDYYTHVNNRRFSQSGKARKGLRDWSSAPIQSSAGAEVVRMLFAWNSSMNAPQTDQIRQIVTSAFSALGAVEPISETVLLRNRYFVGRKYTSGGFVAIWSTDTNLVEVFGQDGQVVQRATVEPQVEKAA
jgi:hypothetical protein